MATDSMLVSVQFCVQNNCVMRISRRQQCLVLWSGTCQTLCPRYVSLTQEKSVQSPGDPTVTLNIYAK